MSEEEYLRALRLVLAEAIMLGTTFSERPCGGLIWDASNRPLWENVDRLYQCTAKFIKLHGFDSTVMQQVFPLHAEMGALAEQREAER